MMSAITKERFERLGSVVRGSTSRRWLILTHDNPDPDALASAALLSRLLRDGFGQKVTAAFGGLIGRAENREMVRSLKLQLSDVRRLDIARYSRFALVDTQPRTGNNCLPEDVVPELVFDHHPPRRESRNAAFADIRPEFGATVSILTEYLDEAEIEVSRACATALVYAIRAETQDFSREYTTVDKAVYDRFLTAVDKRALGKIQKAPLPLSYFRSLHQALEGLEILDTLVVAHLDEVEQPDIVPEIADLLLRIEGKTWALCTGRFGGRVYASIRTTNPRAQAGNIMRRLVGKNGRGGGHGRTAGGWVSVTVGYSDRPRDLQALLGRRLARHLKLDAARFQTLELNPGRDKA